VTHQEDAVSFTDDGAVSFSRFEDGWDPNNDIDRVIMATRRAIYPHHGLIADPSASF
jgi:acetoin utilization protein AcuC